MGEEMSSIGSIFTRICFIVLVFALEACTGQPTAAPGQLQTPIPVNPTGIGSPIPPMGTGEALSITSGPAVTSQPDQATPTLVETSVPVGGELSVTLQNNRQTITMQVGQRFLLNLGEIYNWSPVVADETVVSRVIGITVIRGAQGIYEAHKAGQTTLSATGDPPCRSQKPACMMPSISFQVNIVVQ
jgi:hypothetical protein